MRLSAFQRDEAGAVLVEISILLPIVITILCGSIDFLYAFYQWTAAAKAVQVGARIAAFSDAVAAGLNDLSNQVVLNGSVASRRPMPGFMITCDGRVEACTCSGNCPGISANPYNAAAMNRILFGRGSSSCTDATWERLLTTAKAGVGTPRAKRSSLALSLCRASPRASGPEPV